MSEAVNEKLVEDAGTKISFWKPHKDKRYFHLVLSDEGGYSSVIMTKEMWDGMKAKVDKLIEEHMK